MKNVLKKLISGVLAVVMMAASLPLTVFASTAGQGEDTPSVTMDDGYISVTVSAENGGFLIRTVDGDKLEKSDDNKNLLYPSADYDTSYTSFRVNRTNGDTEEYIFGRKYGFLGLASSDVELAREGSIITATWSVKDLTVVQKLTLLDESAPQHGMVGISYDVTTTADDVASVQARVMLDSNLGDQDYVYYQLPDISGQYTMVKTEALLDNTGEYPVYDGSFFAVDNPTNPRVTAYTVNATAGSQELKPYQVAIGHWNNLGATVFDFVPAESQIDFTNPFNDEYYTADSAYALYYDLGTIARDSTANLTTYYGVFSNSTVGNSERVSINFTKLPASMELNEEKTAYVSQVEGGHAEGDVELQMLIENIIEEPVDEMTVVIKTMNQVSAYVDYYQNDSKYGEAEPYKKILTDVVPGEELSMEVFFQLAPLQTSEYRLFTVECYDTGRESTLSYSNLLGSREFYVLCPGVLGEEVAFNNTNPQVIYTEGTRKLYVSGENFGLLTDTTAYTAYLKPVNAGVDDTGTSAFALGRAAGGDTLDLDSAIPSKNIVVDEGKNTMHLTVDSSLPVGEYQLVLDWNEVGKIDTTSVALQVQVSDDPLYKTPGYGIVTIEKTPEYTDDDPTYQLGTYTDDADYAARQKDPQNMVLLEFRGDFSLRYDEAGNVVEAVAASVEEADGTINGTINISNCLDVEAGDVSITVENPGTDEQVINTDIEGHVYTTNSRTTVWDGVCAITAIANGDVSKLIQYKYDGTPTTDVENTLANTNAITLLWPGAASTAQTIAGMFFEFRYAQFGQMALERTETVKPDTDRRRVIAFGAELNPSFLLPTNYDWSSRGTSTLDAVQLTFAKSHYTSEQLRDYQIRYSYDQHEWMKAAEGTLELYVHDVLFGGGFIGFNTSINIGLPSYTDGMPGIDGVLNLAVWPMDGEWALGIEGTADLEFLVVEAALALKSYEGIPIPDSFRFFIGGYTPGINVDGVGIFWIQGLGGGMENLYETFIIPSYLPPVTLLLSGQFGLFSVLQARADMRISPRSFAVDLTHVGFGGLGDEAIYLLDWVGLSTQWYPEFKLKAGLSANVFDIIKGSGYLIMEENQRTEELFWEGFITASVTTPKIPLIGSVTIGSADLGVNAAKIWGALHILKLDMGVTYYWGGDVDFAFGKYDAPEATLLSMPVYTDEQTGDTLYLAFGTNTELVAQSARLPQSVHLSGVATLDNTPSITSSSDRMHHTFVLGDYADGDMALSLTFQADSLAQAEAIAKGDRFGNPGIAIRSTDDTLYELKWLDLSGNTAIENGSDDESNALLTYDEETGEASVTISFTEEAAFDSTWSLSCASACELALYRLGRLASVDSVSYDAGTIAWTGSQMEDIETLGVYAVGEDESMYILYQTEDTQAIQSGTAEVMIPETMPSGSYTIRLVASSEANNVNEIVDAETKLTYTNPNQPADPTVGEAKLGGDYTIDVPVAPGGSYDGYAVTVYEKDGETDTWTATQFAEQWIEAEEDGSLPEILAVGGSYEFAQYLDAQGSEISYSDYLTALEKGETVSVEQRTVGLEAGKTYRVGVRAYKNLDSGSVLYSTEAFSSELEMREPNPAAIEAKGIGGRALEETDISSGEKKSIDVFSQKAVSVVLSTDMAVNGTWTLDDDAQTGQWSAEANGSAVIQLTGVSQEEDYVGDNGLAQGDHVLKVNAINETGDEVQLVYRFRVDTVAPSLMLSGPDTGEFFGEQVSVTGISEPGAIVYIRLDGEEYTSTAAGEDGSFAVDVAMDPTVLEQTVTVWAADASGNTSREYDLVLTNEKILNGDLAIFLNGENVTGQTLPAGVGGLLELRFVYAYNSDGQILQGSIPVPVSSFMGRYAQWTTQAVAGSAGVERVGSNGTPQLVTSSDVNGMLVVSLDKRQAAVVLGGNADMSENSYPITLPENTVGYTVTTEQELMVNDGGSFTFKVEIAEGYSATDSFRVTANGQTLEQTDGVYIVSNIHAPKTISVEGVADLTPPEATVTVADNSWSQFLNNITFGLFFKETQEAIITAADNGSGVERIDYHISDTALTVEQVKALGIDDWTAYTEPVSIQPDSQCVVYARVMDSAGNISYRSSDGLVVESTPPAVIGVVNGETYYGDQTVTVTDDYLDSVTLDGEAVVLTENAFTIPADNAQHTITATDKAGNATTYTITVYRIYTVTFLADGQSVGTIPVNHGSDLTADQFPGIPPKTGYDQTEPVWNPPSLTNVTADTTVEAVYTVNRYAVTAPEAQVGYTVNLPSDTAAYGEAFSFTVEVAQGYNGDNLKVIVNGVEFQAEEGVYTIHSVQNDLQISVLGVEDTAAPEATVTVGTNAWKEFLNTITFGLFFKQTQEAAITATDDGSGIRAVYYLVSERALTRSEMENSDWTQYTQPVALEPDGSHVVYAKAVDNDDNVTYVSSDGVVVKDSVPVISGVEDGGVYYGDRTVVVTDPYLAQVTVDGAPVDLSSGSFILAADNAEHTIQATDRAGNIIRCTVTVYQIYTVTFVADGKTVGTAQVNHGADLSQDQFPRIPAKAGYDQTAPVWNPQSLTNVTGNTTVEAVYTINRYGVSVPETQVGYTVNLPGDTVAHGESLSFTVEVAQGYNGANLKVTVNGKEIQAVNGRYTAAAAEGELKIEVTGVADTTAPQVTLSVGTNAWKEFLNTITFGLFFKETQEATITATDDGSGLYGLYYLVSNGAVALDDLETSGWLPYTAPVTLASEGQQVIYAKAVDAAGNVCYVNSNGLVIDTTAPQVEGIENGGEYYGDVVFSVTDDNISAITVNGSGVYDADTDGTPAVITLKPADGEQKIVITDQAGNETVLTVVVHETKVPEPDDVCDGINDCPSTAFSDLDTGAWYHLSVDYAIENGLMQGYPDQTFHPGDTLTRAMVVQILYNLEGQPGVSGRASYTDTAADAWYSDAIAWATQNEIVLGYGNGLFGPEDAVTREQMVTIFYRYSSLKGYSLTQGNYDHFTDAGKVSQYADSAMRWAVGNGLIVGNGDGTLSPGSSSTRAEFATVIQRFIETIAKTTD